MGDCRCSWVQPCKEVEGEETVCLEELRVRVNDPLWPAWRGPDSSSNRIRLWKWGTDTNQNLASKVEKGSGSTHLNPCAAHLQDAGQLWVRSLEGSSEQWQPTTCWAGSLHEFSLVGAKTGPRMNLERPFQVCLLQSSPVTPNHPSWIKLPLPTYCVI